MLRRPAHAEQRARSRATILVVAMGVLVFVCGAGIVLLWWGLDAAGMLGIMPLAVLPVVMVPCFLMSVAIRRAGVERGLRGLELWIAPQGITYTCAAGGFPMPWPALRGMYVRGGDGAGGQELCVEMNNWGGPLAKAAGRGKPCTLRMPLDGSGVDGRTIDQAVYEITRGNVRVGAR